MGTVSHKEEGKFTKAEDEEIICWKDLTVELSKHTPVWARVSALKAETLRLWRIDFYLM